MIQTDDDVLIVLRACPRTRRFVTATGAGSTYTIALVESEQGSSVHFIRDTGGFKPMSVTRFCAFWELWCRGSDTLSDFRNGGQLQSRAAAAGYAIPVFEWVAAQLYRRGRSAASVSVRSEISAGSE